MDIGTIQNRYDAGKAYFKQMGFYTQWPEDQRMLEGIQWPPKTERTKNLPRPVLNIIKDIEQHKISNVLQEPVKIVFEPEEAEDQQAIDAAELFTKYSKTAWDNIEQDKLNEQCLITAANIGTCVMHYYWDDSIEGGKSLEYIGDIKGEEIDPINAMAGNPQCKDVQSQPYWILTKRDLVENIKAKAKANSTNIKDIQNITGDNAVSDEAYDSAKYEVSGAEKATIITMYWKEPSTQNTIHVMQICGNVEIMKDTDTKHKLYPIAVMSWHERKKSIYGKGDTREITPNQKAINLMLAVQMMSVQLTGMPRLMVNRAYIEGNITNDPQNIISHNAPNGSAAAQYLQPPAISSITENLTSFLLEQTKTLNGASEYATGELAKTGSSGLNATAIMLMQKAAAVPVEQTKERFHRMLGDVAKIFLEFWTINYNTTRMATLKNDATGDLENISFRGIDFKDISLKVKISVGASTAYSESLMMTSLDNFLSGGYINFQQYLQLVPDSVVPFKEQLLKMLEQQQQDYMTPEEIQSFMQASPDIQMQMLQQMQFKPQQGGEANGSNAQSKSGSIVANAASNVQRPTVQNVQAT